MYHYSLRCGSPFQADKRALIVPPAHVQAPSLLSGSTSGDQYRFQENHNKSKVFVSQKDRVPKYFWASKQTGHFMQQQVSHSK